MFERLSQRYPGKVFKSTYEDLCVDAGELKRLCGFLEIPWDEILGRQTLNGMSQHLPSAFGFINRGGAADETKRRDAQEKIIDDAEADYIRILHAVAMNDGIPPESLIRLQSAGRRRFILESDGCYAARVAALENPNYWLSDRQGVVNTICNLLQSKSAKAL